MNDTAREPTSAVPLPDNVRSIDAPNLHRATIEPIYAQGRHQADGVITQSEHGLLRPHIRRAAIHSAPVHRLDSLAMPALMVTASGRPRSLTGNGVAATWRNTSSIFYTADPRIRDVAVERGAQQQCDHDDADLRRQPFALGASFRKQMHRVSATSGPASSKFDAGVRCLCITATSGFTAYML
ncbi:MAG: hypothetical protein ACT4O1_16490 [Gemmatimonadota bacterium]